MATSELMKKYDVAIWAHHGMFCSGEDFDLTFGLMHTVEKSAEILVKVLSITPNKLQTITPQNFRDLAVDFKVTLPEEFLYEKSKAAAEAERKTKKEGNRPGKCSRAFFCCKNSGFDIP